MIHELGNISSGKQTGEWGKLFWYYYLHGPFITFFPPRYIKGIESILSLSIKKRFSELNVVCLSANILLYVQGKNHPVGKKYTLHSHDYSPSTSTLILNGSCICVT